jgi:hypothetical protein
MHKYQEVRIYRIPPTPKSGEEPELLVEEELVLLWAALFRMES